MKKKSLFSFFTLIICLCLLFQSIARGSANSDTENAQVGVISEDLQAAMKKAGNNDRIPVYLWYQDINHEETESSTEAAIGFSKDEIVEKAQTDASNEALQKAEALRQAGMATEAEINEYLAVTEEIRAKEAEYTDLYISTKRNFEKNLYQVASDAIIKATNIREEDILFSSKYAPMMIVNLTKNAIRDYSKRQEICSLSLYDDLQMVACATTQEWENVKETTGINKTQNISIYQSPTQNINLDGTGVNVGIFDAENIYMPSQFTEFPSNRFHNIGPIYYIDENENNHANNTARIFCSEYGIANNANCYCATPQLSTIYATMELLLDQNVSIINSSFVCTRDSAYIEEDQWLDHISSHHNVTIVVSAGNEDELDGLHINGMASAYNVITVGAYDNKGTASTSDDVIFDYSCYEDFGGCAKPDVVAPANMFGKGTSSSAPYVSGVIALMIQARPSLAVYPEIIKAAVLASCHRQVKNSANTSPQSMTLGLSDKQGAGAFDPFRAVCIVCNGNYGFHWMVQNQTSSSISIWQPQYDSTGINYSVVWPRTNTVSGNDHATGTVTVGTLQNLALTIKDGTTVLGSSNLSNSTTEMVYTNTFPTSHKFTLQITRNTNTDKAVRYAYAWSLSNERYQNARINEGVFTLRMENTSLYLDVDSTHLAKLNTFSSATNKLWVLDRVGASTYLQNANAQTYSYLNVGTLIPSSTEYKATATTASSTIYSMIQKSDGSFMIRRNINTLPYMLDVKNNNATSGEQVVWSPSDMNDSHQRWYVAKYAFQRGDVDMDGSVDADDANYILQIAVNSITPTAAEKYLADCDGDDQISAWDAYIASQIASGLE